MSRPCAAGSVRLETEEGKPLEPEELRVLEAALPPERLEEVRRRAYVDGRVLEREGKALFTWGVAARIVLASGGGEPGAGAAVADILSRTGLDASGRDTGARALVLGALPFDPAVPGTLVVPEVAVVARTGQAPRVILAGAEPELERLRSGFPLAGHPPPLPPEGELPDRFSITSSRSHAAFRDMVATAVAAIEEGGFDKVVLAREVVVEANRPFQQADLLRRLRALHPSCLAFALDGFVGASPELLCRRQEDQVASEPLAGTVARSGDPEADARLADSLLASEKERREHRLVVEAIVSALEPLCAEVMPPDEPVVLELRNVAHLATPVHARLEEGPDAASALELALALHPTPAVGGWPVAPALAYLSEHEQFERGLYAGPLGYVDGNGDGEWWLGLRSAQITGTTARLAAGVGVVEGSDPASELTETQLKLQALLAVAVRP